jgi:hypothetical protein
MPITGNLLNWARTHVSLPSRKLHFIILGLPWQVAEPLATTLLDLSASYDVDVRTTLPPAPHINWSTLVVHRSERFKISHYNGPEALRSELRELVQPIETCSGSSAGPFSTVVFDSLGTYGAALSSKLRKSTGRHAGVILCTPSAIRETNRVLTSGRQLPYYFLGDALADQAMLTNRQLQPVFDKIQTLLNFLSATGIETANLKNAKTLILGSGQLATVAEKWFKDQGSEVKTLSIQAHLGKTITGPTYQNAVGEASIIVSAHLAADSNFLATTSFKEKLRDQTMLINLAATPIEFGLDQFLYSRSALINPIPFIARTFRLPQLDGSMKRIFMLGDGHPLIDLLHISNEVECTVAALLLASSEILIQTETPGRLPDAIRPSQRIHDLLSIGYGQ